MAATQFWTIFAGVIGVIALAVYLFGIPPEMKRKLERQALQTMGENKMSYVVKGTSPCKVASQEKALTLPRPDLQGPRIRPRKRPAAQERPRQCCWWFDEQPNRRGYW